MTDQAVDRLVALLSEATRPAAFSASCTASTGDLKLEVRGVGPISLPVSAAQARQLCMVARPARHGQGERTVLDRRVRDTWEVPRSRVKIDKRRFEATLQPALDRLGRDLSLPPGRTPTAELHSMLVYGPGQFFLEHQDSEKDDAMIGTLVLGLPSAFTGGALQVRHRGRTVTYRGSKKALSFVAFYGDCRHEVRRVTSGYRVVLTYNLLLDGSATPGPGRGPNPELVGALADCLDEHLASAGGADRLICLLDHEYTRRGLDRSRLKGTDSERAALLTAAAERAACELTLGLVNLHETWSAYDAEERSSRWAYWDEDDDPIESVGGEYELEEMLDSEATLDSWIDPRDGRAKEIGLPVDDIELCASTPSQELEPYASEYEGYMGNWGNTLDRWYHRGALVIWPRRRTFAVQAEADPSFALDALAARAKAGGPTAARLDAATLAPFWSSAAARAQTTALLDKALRVARLIDDSELAMMLLAPFSVELLGHGQAKALSAAIDSYGVRWAKGLAAAWAARWQGYYADSVEAWIATLPALCSALDEAGEGGTGGARLLLAETWTWVQARIATALALSSPSGRDKSLTQLAPSLAAILEAASLVGATELREEAVGLLCGNNELLGCALAMLKVTADSRWSATGLDALAVHSSAALATRLDEPPRQPDDWSIELPQGCGCELCTQLRDFLADPTETRLEWPLAKERRRHVHSRIDGAELPLTHHTRRTGRPYTLVLTKTETLFERETQQRHRDQQDLDWLEQHWIGRTRR